MKLKNLNMNRVWAGFFAIWMLLLTGTLGFWLKSPGVKQWYSVSQSLKEQRQEIADVESNSTLLAHTAHQLEFNSVAQEREIRKVLGYLGDQELVFEFESK
jgi:cell division protein FtsB